MPLNDDEDDIIPSLSHQEAFTRADHGKAEDIRQHIKEELGAQKAAQAKEAELKTQVNLKQLEQQLAGKQDEETRRKQEEEEKAAAESTAPKTKSLKEEEQGAETAYDQVSPDSLIEQDEQQEDVSDEETQAQPG